ncbi:hypothetical protein [Phenylobacterium kunshanense]|uniref:hypothetical protein n=1 Tax=Phenylobacterium kunshanense TaxID=1445034 RepID=UPI001401FD7C|nr:hypothetical protein [Phenylobacterium kunshanense]
MADHESLLRDMGVALGGVGGDIGSANRVLENLANHTLSGYGEYTPITVRSYSMPEHAHLERNQ